MLDVEASEYRESVVRRLDGIAGAESRLTDGRPVALVHLDAHTDTYENIEHWMGARKSAAHWAAYTVRQGNVDAGRSTRG